MAGRVSMSLRDLIKTERRRAAPLPTLFWRLPSLLDLKIKSDERRLSSRLSLKHLLRYTSSVYHLLVIYSATVFFDKAYIIVSEASCIYPATLVILPIVVKVQRKFLPNSTRRLPIIGTIRLGRLSYSPSSSALEPSVHLAIDLLIIHHG